MGGKVVICKYCDRSEPSTVVLNWGQCEIFTPTEFYKRHTVPTKADLDREAAMKHNQIMHTLQAREDEIDEGIKADEAEHKAKMALMEKEWKMQIDKDSKLKETYEGLMKSRVIDELPLLGEDVMEEEIKEEDSQWSNDGSSVASVDMGEATNGGGDEAMVDRQDSSEGENWSMSDSDDQSGSESEG